MLASLLGKICRKLSVQGKLGLDLSYNGCTGSRAVLITGNRQEVLLPFNCSRMLRLNTEELILRVGLLVLNYFLYTTVVFLGSPWITLRSSVIPLGSPCLAE